jgi:hypothetical protein
MEAFVLKPVGRKIVLDALKPDNDNFSISSINFIGLVLSIEPISSNEK